MVDEQGRTSVARGLAVLAVCAALLTLARFTWGGDSRPDAERGAELCLALVAVDEPYGERVACLGAPELAACGLVRPGDKARIDGAACVVEPGGMSAPARLLSGLKLDLNRATASELELLEGVGPHLAAAIVAARTKRGRFASFRELAAVPGIGPVLLAKLELGLYAE